MITGQDGSAKNVLLSCVSYCDADCVRVHMTRSKTIVRICISVLIIIALHVITSIQMTKSCINALQQVYISRAIRTHAKARMVGNRRHDHSRLYRRMNRMHYRLIRRRITAWTRLTVMRFSVRMLAPLIYSIAILVCCSLDLTSHGDIGIFGFVLLLLRYTMDDMLDITMTELERDFHMVTSRDGLMNKYGSEGPTAKEREEIKKNNQHPLLFSSINKNSITSV